MSRPLAVDAKGAANLLGVSERHIDTLHSSGRMPAPIHLGTRRLWHVGTLNAWLAAGAPSRDEWERLARVALSMEHQDEGTTT